jgi:hypothetical protein
MMKWLLALTLQLSRKELLLELQLFKVGLQGDL